METHCSHPACTRRVAAGVFACRQHWFALPGEIRTRVAHEHRRWVAGIGTLGELRAAQAAALIAWR